MFDNLLKHSNHLNLFSEDIDFKTRRLLGNFPQAYSHLALIDTALNFNLELTIADIWIVILLFQIDCLSKLLNQTISLISNPPGGLATGPQFNTQKR